MHFRLLKMIATSGFVTALECAPPDLLAGLRGLVLRGGDDKGRERREGGEGREEGKR